MSKAEVETRVTVEPQERVGHPTEQLEIEDSNPMNETEDESQYPTGKKLFFVTSSILILCASVGLDIAIVAVTIPALSDHFKSIADIGWYSTTVRLVMCSFMFLFGKAYTLFEVKPLFVSSIGVYLVGNAVCTFAQTSNAFIAGRAISGFGCAGMLGGLFTIFTQAFPLRKRPLIGGIAGGIETLSCVAAPLIGGVLIDKWTWRACYGISLPIGGAGALVVAFLLELPPNPNSTLPWKEKVKRLDIFGTAVFVPAMTCFLLALEWGATTYGWKDARVITSFVIFAVCIAAFAWLQYRYQDRAMLPFKILGNRNILAGAWFAACSGSSITLIEYWLSIYFQGVRGYSATQSGIYAVPQIVGMCVAGLTAGAATSWLGYYVPFMWVTTILSPIAAGLLTTIDLNTSLAKLLCLQALLGFACGTGGGIPQVAAQTVLSPHEVSIGLAIVSFGAQIGPVIFTVASTALFTGRLKTEVLQRSPMTNITSLENMGLSDIRKNLGGVRLGEILLGYDKAVVQTLYLPLALCCLTLVGTLAMEWRSVKQKKQ